MKNNKFYIDRRIKGGALSFALFFSIITAILLSSYLLHSLYSRTYIARIGNGLDLEENARSGISLMLARRSEEMQEHMEVDLFGLGNDSVSVDRFQWGIYEIISASAYRLSDSSHLTVLTGCHLPKDTALILAPRKNKLVIDEFTHIRGHCVPPQKGISIGNPSKKENSGTLSGSTLNCIKTLPRPSEEMIHYINSFFKTHAFSDEYPIPDSLNRDFNLPTLSYFSPSSILLETQHLSGNIIIHSEKEIIVASTAHLQDIILVAPKITLRANFSGRIQAIACDSIIAEKSISLEYPSSLILVNEVKTPFCPALILDSGSSIQGCVVAWQNAGSTSFPMRLEIGNAARVFGLAYCNAFTLVSGTVYGTLISELLVDKAIYGSQINRIRDATLDAFSVDSKAGMGTFLDSSNRIILVVL